MKEIWKDIEGYDGAYQISNFGNVRSFKTTMSKLLKLHTQSSGYLRCTLSKNGKIKVFFVHRLVAQAFIPNPDNLPQINHKDENKQNNRVDNLEWCSASYNYFYGVGYELRKKSLIEAWKRGKKTGRTAWNKGVSLKDTGMIDNFIKAGRLNGEHRKKSIYMLDMHTNEILKEFDSASSAARYLNKNYASSIIACANGNLNSALGYKWQYKIGG